MRTSSTNAASLLPQDAAEHLAAYQRDCGHATQLEALIEIIRTHAVIAEMTAREGSSMSVIEKNTRVANAWHRQGVRGTPVMPDTTGAVAH